VIASQELDKEQFFQSIVETVSRTLGLPAAIWLADETGEALRIAAATDLPDDSIDEAFLRLNEPSVASDVFATGQAIVVTDIASDDRWKYKAEAAAMGLKSAMVAPLQVKQKIVGVLDVYTRETRDFSDSEKALIESIATQVAITERRIRDLAALNEVSLLINSELYLPELFRRITLSATRALDCQHVSVFLMDESGDLLLEATSAKGIARSRFAPGEGLAGWVAQNGQSALVPDAVNDPRFVPGLSSDIAERSMLLVPITTVGEEIVGVISADKDGLAGFDEHDQSLLGTLASQAAVAVRNARLFERETSRSTVLQRLHQIGEQLLSAELSARGLRKVLRQIARSARSVLGADLVEVYQYIQAEDRYILPPILEGERQHPTVVKEKIFEDDIAVKVVEGGEPLYRPDAQGDRLLSGPFTVERPERPEKRFVVREGVLSSAAVPLKAAGETMGVMFINYRTWQDFTPDQRAIIELFANQAALAIYNARVYRQLTRRVQGLAALNEIGQTLTTGIRLKQDEIMELIYEQAKKLTGTQDMYIALYDEETGLICFGLATEHGERVHYEPREADMQKRGKTEEVIFTRRPILHRTLAESEAWYGQPGHQEFIGRVSSSWLGVPMVAGDKVLGMIAMYDWEREYAYDEQDLQVVSSMASQTAIALDNAMLYYEINRQLPRRVEALAALNKIGQTLTAGIRLKQDAILELIYEQAKELTGAQDMYIALYDEETGMIRFGLATEYGEPVHIELRKADMQKRGKTEEVIFTRSPILHRTLAESKAWYGQPGHQEFIGRVSPSWLGVPMVVGERVLGTIAIYDWEREYAYDEQDLRAVSSMASQAAIALDNARLYEEARSEAIAAKQLATLGTAIAALQHRINNTFNIIVPNVTRLRKRVDMTDETIVEMLDIIERNARYTSDIITRIQEPLREVEVQDVDVNAVLSDVVSKVRELWRTDSTQPLVEVTLDLDDSIPQIQAPIGQVAEAFRNLVDNGYRAMKAGGQLTVTSQYADDMIQVRVRDTGGGIPPAVQKHLFVRPVPSKEPGRGAGLGLWLSRLMLQSIGGDVTIEKTSSTGTTMLAQIPAPGAGEGGRL
jgi:GAF domain-containing protein